MSIGICDRKWLLSTTERCAETRCFRFHHQAKWVSASKRSWKPSWPTPLQAALSSRWVTIYPSGRFRSRVPLNMDGTEDIIHYFTLRSSKWTLFTLFFKIINLRYFFHFLLFFDLRCFLVNNSFFFSRKTQLWLPIKNWPPLPPPPPLHEVFFGAIWY